MSQDARLDEEQSTQRRAGILKLDYSDTSQPGQKQIYPALLTVADLRSLRVIPLQADEHYILFGITNTTSQQTIHSLHDRFADQRIAFAMISDTGFNDYMRLYDPPKEVKYQDIALAPSSADDQLKIISTTLAEVKSDDMLAYLVKQAYHLKASDIHLETNAKEVRVRFRVDGVLHAVAKITNEKYHQLMSSIAVAANISTNTNDSQTGHINRQVIMSDGSTVTVNLRVETVPTVYGYDAVLRLFTFNTELLKLDSLGLSAYQKSIINDVISHPNGLVLLVGPTGSGKTTTLYSILNQLNNDTRKIITLEDPVEYNIDGITQIPVISTGNETGFAERLRAVLRLDPDIVMVGEIRDLDTARTALQASLTGHLVLSTYHAGSSAAAITRLLDAIDDNPLFPSTIRLVAAQRLVRRLDNATKQPYQPDDAEKAYVQKIIEHLPEGIQKPDLQNLTLYKPGASAENPFGYSGLVALREFMLINDAIKAVLRRPTWEITSEAIEAAAIGSGMLSMLEEGVLKALDGQTTLSELSRVF